MSRAQALTPEEETAYAELAAAAAKLRRAQAKAGRGEGVEIDEARDLVGEGEGDQP